MTATLRTGPPPRRPRAPAAGCAALAIHRHRTAADRATGRGAAASAGHQRCVTGARYLDENRPILQGASQRPVRQRGNPGRPGGPLPFQLGRTGHLDARHHCAHDMPRCSQVTAPALLDQRLRLHRAAEAADEQAGALKSRTQSQHRTCMSVRCVGLGQPTVRVIPDHSQAQPPHRSEGRRPSTHHHPRTPQQQGQKDPVAPGWSVLCREHHHRFLPQLLPEPSSLLGRCHNDDRAP